MFHNESYNPYAPPTTTIGAAPGQHRHYGLVTRALNFSTIYKLNRHPLVWLYWKLHPILAVSRERFNVGVINPAAPSDLQIEDLERHIKTMLSIEHETLNESGFRFAGFFNGPSFGLSKSLGEVWFDEHSICLSLIVQVVSLRRGKTVSKAQILYTKNSARRTTQTTNSAVSLFDDPNFDSLQLPGAKLADLVVCHRDRVPEAEGRHALAPHDVWYMVWEFVQQEVHAMERAGLLAPLTDAQLTSLIEYSQFIDFRERKIPTLLRWVFSLKLPIYLALFALAAEVIGNTNFRWMFVMAAAWWLLNGVISAPLFKFWLHPSVFDNLPTFDYFRGLRKKR